MWVALLCLILRVPIIKGPCHEVCSFLAWGEELDKYTSYNYHSSKADFTEEDTIVLLGWSLLIGSSFHIFGNLKYSRGIFFLLQNFEPNIYNKSSAFPGRKSEPVFLNVYGAPGIDSKE